MASCLGFKAKARQREQFGDSSSFEVPLRIMVVIMTKKMTTMVMVMVMVVHGCC